MTDIDIHDLANREAGFGSRSLPWPRIGGAARAIAAIVALMLAASVPMVLRLWLFYPSIHN